MTEVPASNNSVSRLMVEVAAAIREVLAILLIQKTRSIEVRVWNGLTHLVLIGMMVTLMMRSESIGTVVVLLNGMKNLHSH